MPTPAASTWTYEPSSVTVRTMVDSVKIDLGDGVFRTGLKSIAWTHQDGTGGADTSHPERRVFTVEFPIVKYGSNFTGPLDFLRSRVANGFQTFNFYDPMVENTVANWDGTARSGLHLVKYFGGLQYTEQSNQLVQMGRVQFFEVQS